MSDLKLSCQINLKIMFPHLMLEFSKNSAIFERAITRAKPLCNLWEWCNLWERPEFRLKYTVRWHFLTFKLKNIMSHAVSRRVLTYVENQKSPRGGRGLKHKPWKNKKSSLEKINFDRRWCCQIMSLFICLSNWGHNFLRVQVGPVQ